MPIRFRCAYCNQLMGIARRKAGTVVQCPKCQGQVVVPHPQGDEANDDDQNSGGDQPANLFEQPDFSKYLKLPEGPTATAAVPNPTAPAAAPAAKPAPQPHNAAAWSAPAAPQPAPTTRGVLLTPGILTLLCVFVVLLLGLAFFVGLLLGKSSATP